MLSAFILTSCHKNILASFFTPTPIIVLMDNVMKFKFFSSIILTNCHKNNIKHLHLVNNVNYYFQFISSFLFFQTVFKKLIFMGGKRKGLLYDLMHAKTIVRLVTCCFSTLCIVLIKITINLFTQVIFVCLCTVCIQTDRIILQMKIS